MYYVATCQLINVQSIITGRIMVIHWAWGVHDLTIFSGFWKQKETTRVLRKLASYEKLLTSLVANTCLIVCLYYRL